jgi:hypothetical protein
MTRARDIADSTKTLSVDGGTIKLDGNYPVGPDNVALGNTVFDSITATVQASTALGSGSLETVDTGIRNTAVGRAALRYTTSGSYNVAMGSYALQSNTTAIENVAVGYQALLDNTTGEKNTAVGTLALANNTTASNNSAFGREALKYNTTGFNNVAVGREALALNTTADYNTAVGYQSAYSNTTGYNNIAFGAFSAKNNTTGASNVSLGYAALISNTTASNNTAVGYQAGYSITTGSYSTFIGRNAGTNTTGGENTFIGSSAGNLVTTGQKNTILGKFDGNNGGLDIRTSSNNIVLADGDGNPRMYTNSAGTSFFGTTTDGNSALNASVISVGPVASQNGIKVQTNSSSNFVAYAGKGGNTSWYYGHMVNPSNTAIGSILCSASSVSYNTSSDYRLKENVVAMTGATDRLKQLNPSRFNFIADADTTVDGFLAHEVQSVVPEAITGTKDEVDADNNPVYQGIDQSKLVPLLVATIQELEARITALEAV